MPLYEFYNTETKELEDHLVKLADYDEFLENNPHLERRISAAAITGGHGDRVKTDDGFKEVLSKIGDAHPGSEVHARHGSKDIKREKTLATVKKHMDIQSKKG